MQTSLVASKHKSVNRRATIGQLHMPQETDLLKHVIRQTRREIINRIQPFSYHVRAVNQNLSSINQIYVIWLDYTIYIVLLVAVASRLISGLLLVILFVAKSLAFSVMFCRSLLVHLSVFVWSLYYLTFFHLRLLITPLIWIPNHT